MLVYDCEIKNMICGRNEIPEQGLQYCGGWSDFSGMGISVICAYDYDADRYRVFMDDNINQFAALVAKHDYVIGYNNISFDDKLVAAHGVTVKPEQSYDLLVELWKAAKVYDMPFKNRAGFKLDDVAHANNVSRKTGNGILAPKLYQRGNIGELVDYCINDVVMTKTLVDRLHSDCYLYDPRNIEKRINVRLPVEVLGSGLTQPGLL